MDINFWNPFGFDLYPLLRYGALAIDPELKDDLFLKALSRGLTPTIDAPDEPVLRTSAFGIDFATPLGLAAGFDKNANVIEPLMNLGFGFVEVGSVFSKPVSPNAERKVFCLPEAKALLHRHTQSSEGADIVAQRLKDWREKPMTRRCPLGVNIAPNDGADDVAHLIAKTAPWADYLTLCLPAISSSKDDENAQKAFVSTLFKLVMECAKKERRTVPVLVKISPDLSEDDQRATADAVQEHGLAGIIVGDSTTSRPSNVPRDLAEEQGGLSGGPLFSLSTRALSNMFEITRGKVPLIACGGVCSGEDAYAKIRAGASLVQVHTALLYEGPLLVERMTRELAALLKHDRFASVSEAVGADHEG